ncbi:MAG: DUF599 family protein [Thiolinea sp.]
MFTLDLTLTDWLSLLWFFLCWVGYTRFSGYRSRPGQRLQDALHGHIRNWIAVLQNRENRITDTAVITNIERSSTFLASSSLLIIAGLTTALGSSDKATHFLSSLPFIPQVNPHRWEIGIILMIMAFIYAFFTFTWCMRQWGFASILVGSTPDRHDASFSTEERKRQQEALAKVVWLAIYHFNTGLRAYYFSLALLAWFVHPFAFILASSWVVAVLYRREFHSRTLHALVSGLK